MKKLLLILAFILFGTIVNAQEYEIWGTFKIAGKLNDKWKVEMEGEDRYNFTEYEIRYFHFDIGAIYSLGERFGVGLFYRDIFGHKGDDYIKSTVPHLDFFYSAPSGFKIRMRHEYIIIYDNFNSYRFRLRPGFQTKWFKNFNPFIQDELFIAEVDDLSRNRLNMGVTIKLGKFYIQPGYLLESNHKSDWSHRNILWVNTKVKF